MSFIGDELKELPFYLTRPTPCPYLDGQVEQKIFTRLSGTTRDDAILISQLTPFGFRRSQNIVYRPACPTCMACVPVRIDVTRFALTRNLRKIQQRNRDLATRILRPMDAAQLYPMFHAYQQARHQDGDMATMSEDDFQSMMQDGGAAAELLCLEKSDGSIIAAMLIDRLNKGTSAVYSFFSTDEEKRSLGTELILRLIDMTQQQHLSHVYLGYWIKQCKKMAYKSRFPALERLGANGWEIFAPES